MMTSAPRWAVHQALAERTPATYAARQAPAQQLGISPDMEDSAIAYRLLLEVRLISLGRLERHLCSSAALCDVMPFPSGMGPLKCRIRDLTLQDDGTPGTS